MTPTGRKLVQLISIAGLGLAVSCCAADLGTNTPQSAEAAYEHRLEKRAADILSALQLKDPVAVTNVRELVIGQYRALRDWHEENDPRLKGASAEQTRALTDSLKALHDKFILLLTAHVTPAQVEIVKDKMTYNKVKVTYDAYCANNPGLTDAQKIQVLKMLKQAREEAMDAGSSDEKNKIFRKYKGRINNYLSGKADSKETDKAAAD